MDLKQVRQRCEERLRTLDLPAPFDVRALCARLALQRRRPIVLQPVASGVGCYGLWVALPTADIIFYERETSPLHQEHIVLHEVCHLVAGHQPAPVSREDAARLLFPDLAPELVQRLLQRAGYSTDEEREAEVLASLILERADRAPATEAPPRDPRTAEVLGRLEATLDAGAG